tara:strand:+ start:155 stop:625 length:471 start_codon:yes stop_codon:yes gene_type:complete
MGVIKPTFTLTANSSSATTDAGPLSIALSLSATDSLDVTKVESKILDVKIDHTASTDAGVLWDASDYLTPGDAAVGTDGAFVYIKNTSDTATHEISIGHGTAAHILGAGNSTRLMTLKGGEFAWLPWDLTQDLVYDANGDYTGALETWLFVRTGTA